ncbi:class I SAM-dependent methyltransferase [Halalkalicoccus jeotgali]|uniref:Methyltransferase type 11 n=1 Tax=Halalkalicoccus jeotgali (strain DSM 18796 / CECT 7217 / JCM 14584 / KCTC 4019 / B3) TaxID=795797 RepID=D8J624_HALJB|nr:class I SAM-dependent methyltransferase [Halalkalicoccus jeotgali]ADJ13830.1 Methyltransferase type 11 [Halalkalicoccus jeotgali B3]ELY34124.1 type 11 methyltransferase [Halalkalicoccus jeotgali B3]
MNPNDVKRQWAERSGEYSPEYYAYYGPDEASELLRRTLASYFGSDPAILELGCSSGRHLAHLHEHGFSDLSGVEINDEAVAVMERTYPELADDATVYVDAIEDVLAGFEDDRFDAVYSVETLQHIHPDNAWVFEDVTRVASDLLLTVENEGDGEESVNYVRDEFPLYYRDWRAVFAEFDCREVESERLKRDTFRAFRPA